ncbi:hypothetical protein D3C72_753990 [compost metagenome]
MITSLQFKYSLVIICLHSIRIILQYQIYILCLCYTCWRSRVTVTFNHKYKLVFITIDHFPAIMVYPNFNIVCNAFEIELCVPVTKRLHILPSIMCCCIEHVIIVWIRQSLDVRSTTDAKRLIRPETKILCAHHMS